MFVVATSTVTLPITVVAPISSTSGEAAAYSRASASSTPVSTSRIRGVGLMDREPTRAHDRARQPLTTSWNNALYSSNSLPSKALYS